MGVPRSAGFASRDGAGASTVILDGAEHSHHCGWSSRQKDYSRSLYLMYNFLVLHKTIALGLQSHTTDKERVWLLVAAEERQKAQNIHKYCKLLLLLLVLNNREVYQKSWFTEIASCQSQESKYAGF